MKRLSFILLLAAAAAPVFAGPLTVAPHLLPYLAEEHFQVPADLRFPREISDAVNRGMVGGKRVRPLLCYLSAGVLGTPPETVKELACAVEYVHNASLIHDDVIDASTQRRNDPTLWVQKTVKEAVVIGDWLMAEGVKLAARARSPHQVPTLLNTIQEMTRGEAQQANALREGSYDIRQWTEVANAKTGVLFAWALTAPAREAGVSETLLASLDRLGLILGQLFQAQDDIKDSYDERGEMNLVLLEAAQMDQADPLGRDFRPETLTEARRRVAHLLRSNGERALAEIDAIVGHAQPRWDTLTATVFAPEHDVCVQNLRAFAVLVSSPPAGL